MLSSNIELGLEIYLIAHREWISPTITTPVCNKEGTVERKETVLKSNVSTLCSKGERSEAYDIVLDICNAKAIHCSPVFGLVIL